MVLFYALQVSATSAIKNSAGVAEEFGAESLDTLTGVGQSKSFYSSSYKPLVHVMIKPVLGIHK